MPGPREPDVAIAHDYLTQRGGAEKVVLALARTFPEASITTTLFEPNSTYPEFGDLTISTTWLNKFPVLRRNHRLALPLFAPVVSRTRIKAACTIASSSGWAHGFATSGPKLVYCYSPARWLYQTDAYLGDRRISARRALLGLVRKPLQSWDRRKAREATRYLAISTAVQSRIKEAYGIESHLVPAPHTMDANGAHERPAAVPAGAENEGFNLCVSRLLPYKNVSAVIDAHRQTGTQLVVVGSGPEEGVLRKLAPASVIFLKDLTEANMRWLYSRCDVVVSASYEDYGLTPLEGAAFGKPCVVLRWGGFLDTVIDNVTGVYFDEPSGSDIAEALRTARAAVWDSEFIRSHADKFSEEVFAGRIRQHVSELLGTA